MGGCPCFKWWKEGSDIERLLIALSTQAFYRAKGFFPHQLAGWFCGPGTKEAVSCLCKKREECCLGFLGVFPASRGMCGSSTQSFLFLLIHCQLFCVFILSRPPGGSFPAPVPSPLLLSPFFFSGGCQQWGPLFVLISKATTLSNREQWFSGMETAPCKHFSVRHLWTVIFLRPLTVPNLDRLPWE